MFSAPFALMLRSPLVLAVLALGSLTLALAACSPSRSATQSGSRPVAASSATSASSVGAARTPTRAPLGLPRDARILWLDATANFERIGTRAGLVAMLAKTADAGFTDVVIDVKPLSGEVLFATDFAPRLRTFGGFTRADTFDFVGVSIHEGRRLGMRVHLAANTFSAGHKSFSTGPAYTTRPEWQTTLLASDGTLKPTTAVAQGYSAFVNPARADVQANELALVRDLVARYQPDGFVIDRGRYDNLYSDFSPESRAAFEAWLGRPVANWPSDVMTRSSVPAAPNRGPLFKPWLEWRASIIRGYFERARQTVKAAHPATRFAVYVGAWYPAYYEVGVNWASPDYDPSEDFDWATPTYRTHGYAPLLDFMMTGNYYVEVTPADLAATNTQARLDNVLSNVRDTVYNVESSIRDVARKVRGATVVVPSLYVEQYKDAGKPEHYARALRKALDMTGSVMVFDLVHLERNPALWESTRAALRDFPPGRATPY